MSNAVRLVVSDIDGTLLDSRLRLTESARGGIRELRERGISFSLASGRPARVIKALADELELEAPFIALGGALLADRDLRVLWQAALAPDTARDILDRLHHAGLPHWVHSTNDWLTLTKADRFCASRVELEAATVGFQPRRVPAFLEQDVLKISVLGGTEEMELARSVASLSPCEAMLTGNNSCQSLEITAAGVHKGAALRRLSWRLGLVAERDVAVIGDTPADIPMFKASRLSIAMGNAEAAVKAAADHSVRDHDHEGFAGAVSDIILRERGNSPRAVH